MVIDLRKYSSRAELLRAFDHFFESKKTTKIIVRTEEDKYFIFGLLTQINIIEISREFVVVDPSKNRIDESANMSVPTKKKAKIFSSRKPMFSDSTTLSSFKLPCRLPLSNEEGANEKSYYAWDIAIRKNIDTKIDTVEVYDQGRLLRSFHPGERDHYLRLMLYRGKSKKLEVSIEGTGEIDLPINRQGEIVPICTPIIRSIKHTIERAQKAFGYILRGDFQGFRQRIYRHFKIAVFLFMFFHGCVLPPENNGPRILQTEELEYVTSRKLAQNFARSSRFDISEFHARKALKLRPDLASSWNDLGYSLQRLQRYSEAEAAYNRALLIQREYLPARENLARLYFELGRDDESFREYERVIQLYRQYWNETSTSQMSFTRNDYVSALRNASMIGFYIGKEDESLCYAKIARDQKSSLYTPVDYIRYLISLDRGKMASEEIDTLLKPKKIATSPIELNTSMEQNKVEDELIIDPDLMVERAIVSWMIQDRNNLYDALRLAASSPSVTSDQRLRIRLLRMYFTDREGLKGLLTIDESAENIVEEYPQVCQEDFQFQAAYWPKKLVDDISSFRGRLCSSVGLPIESI